MARTNTDFLQFNAYQIKDTILRKLSEDSKFTDQVYEGSNLAVLIDIVSYMLQGLLYSLNSAAAESMFADTQFYENIVRLCQFLGYNPHGCSVPTAEFIITEVPKNLENYGTIIPRYSYINTGKTTPSGETIYYSVDSYGIGQSFIEKLKSITMKTAINKVNLFSGKWKLYKSALVTTGENWETFTLDLKSDYESGKYIPHGFIDIYAKTPEGEWIQFKPVDTQLFRRNNKYNADSQLDDESVLYAADLRSASLSPNSEQESDATLNSESLTDNGIRRNDIKDAVFNLRLDENKHYVITFGDGITAAKPPKNSILYIVYLESAGPGSEIEPGEILDEKILKPKHLGFSNDFWDILVGTNSEITGQSWDDYKVPPYGFSNITKSTSYVKEETVDEIRENAPNWFKSGGRLVTKDDYENFFKYTPIFNNVYFDVKCQNNWEYVATFYKWLYDLGRSNHKDPTYYLNQNSLIKSRYPCSDAADCNNIYLWFRPKSEGGGSSMTLGRELYEKTYAIKDMTHEPIPVPGIPVSYVITAAPKELIIENIKQNNYYDNTKLETTLGSLGNKNGCESYIEVLIDDNVMYANSYVASIISEKIRTFFESRQMGLGYSPDLSELMATIYNINGILRVRTIYYEKDSPEKAIIYNGLSFATFSVPENGLLDVCEDLEVSPNSRSLEIFQYPSYNYSINGTSNTNRYSSLLEQFKVIKRSGSPLELVVF